MKKAKHIFVAMLLALAVVAPFVPTVRAAAAEAALPDNILPVNHDVSRQDVEVMNGSRVGAVMGITVVDETTDLTTKIAPDTDEDYRLENKQWNGIPTVITAGDNVFVAWYTGGDKEPHKHNYINIAASDDYGQTWRETWMIITAKQTEKNTGLAWPLFFYNGAGELCLTYGDSKRTGTQMMKFYNADGPLDGIRYTKPVKTGPDLCISCKPTLLKNGDILSVYGSKDAGGHVLPTTVVRSTDGGVSFPNYSTIKSSVDDAYHQWSEYSIVEKLDGTLWGLGRLENGMGIEQTFSTDGGKTWSETTTDLENPPFFTPGSRFYMARLNSGNLLFVTNMAGRGTDRRKMTVWLSEDDGETWPYSLEVDPTQTSYPDFYQSPDGKIWLAHDRDRFGEGGIRLHVFTEADVKAGEFLDGSRQGVIITKMDPGYGDIVDVGGAFEKVERYPVGTAAKDILSNKPTTITVTDDNGKTYELKGFYRVSEYDANTPGLYTVYFMPDEDLPAKLKDGYKALSFKIELTGSAAGKKGCGGAAGAASAPGGLILLTIAAAGAAACKNRREQ